ncbi:MAG: universal stress protein [Thermoanaerobaculia bacterium]
MAEAPRYLVGVDFSPRSRRALAFARDLAARSGATLTIAHVRPFSDVRSAVVLERGDLLRNPGRKLPRKIKALYEEQLAALRQDGERILLLKGAPDVALCREARRGYDLLILGRRGPGAISSILPGSTALRTLACSTVPVLFVPAGKG